MKTTQKILALLITALIVLITVLVVLSCEKEAPANPVESGGNAALYNESTVHANKDASRKTFIIKTRRTSPVYSKNETHQLSQKQRPCKQIGHIYAMKLAMLYWLLKRH